MKFSTEELIEGIQSGNKRLIAKAITLVESKKAEHRIQAEELLKRIMPFTGKSVRVGVTGVPGAGKSTFIESFGRLAIAQGKKVAVLAIDPSSSINKGSILGDKTRMEELAKEENAFIRPSPSSGFLGGVAVIFKFIFKDTPLSFIGFILIIFLKICSGKCTNRVSTLYLKIKAPCFLHFTFQLLNVDSHYLFL